MNALGIVLAGGLGTRLAPLTKDRAKPAVPFGGAYRIIDFVMTNLFNSGIHKVALLTQHRPESLQRHVREGYLPAFGSGRSAYIEAFHPRSHLTSTALTGEASPFLIFNGSPWKKYFP